MPCTRISIPGGGAAIVCTRGPRLSCACGRRPLFQCDAPKPRKLISSGPNAGRVGKIGTCDRHLCAKCATEVGPDRHLCPDHAAAGELPADPQPSLF